MHCVVFKIARSVLKFQITNDDITKTYGGGAMRTYYSGAYSSSTNAYMLMYRQINESINCPAIKVEEFPDHIKVILNDNDLRGKVSLDYPALPLNLNFINI